MCVVLCYRHRRAFSVRKVHDGLLRVVVVVWWSCGVHTRSKSVSSLPSAVFALSWYSLKRMSPFPSILSSTWCSIALLLTVQSGVCVVDLEWVTPERSIAHLVVCCIGYEPFAHVNDSIPMLFFTSICCVKRPCTLLRRMALSTVPAVSQM